MQRGAVLTGEDSEEDSGDEIEPLPAVQQAPAPVTRTPGMNKHTHTRCPPHPTMLRVGLSPSGAGVVFSGEDDEEEDTDSDADAPGGGAATTRAAAAAAGAGAGAGGAAQDPAAAAAAAVIARTKSGKAHQGKQLMHSGLSAVLNPVLEKLAARVEELQTSQLVRARRGDRTSACRGD